MSKFITSSKFETVTEKITSLELVKQINIFREKEGNRKELRHADLLKVIRNEFEDEIRNKIISESVEIRKLPQGGSAKYPYFELTLNQAKQVFIIMKANPTDSFCKKYNMNIEFNILSKTRFETSFGNILIPILKKMGYDVFGQYNIDGYRIDFYIPKLNIAIEYDEKHHYTKKGIYNDSKRQSYIEEKLNCKFIRLDYRVSDAENVGIVLNELFTIKK